MNYDPEIKSHMSVYQLNQPGTSKTSNFFRRKLAPIFSTNENTRTIQSTEMKINPGIYSYTPKKHMLSLAHVKLVTLRIMVKEVTGDYNVPHKGAHGP